MAEEKKYTAQEAAKAVLAKAEDMLKAYSAKKELKKEETIIDQNRADGGTKSADKKADKDAHIEKGETGHEKGINTASDPKQKSRVMMGTSKAGSQLPSKDKADISEAKDAHKSVLSEMKNMPKPKLTKGEMPPKSEKATPDAEPKSDKAFQVRPSHAPEGKEPRLNEQKAPEANPKEQAEGNNEKAGTTPTQVGQDQKNKPGFDEMKGIMKLAKFMGRMEHKKGAKVEA